MLQTHTPSSPKFHQIPTISSKIAHFARLFSSVTNLPLSMLSTRFVLCFSLLLSLPILFLVAPRILPFRAPEPSISLSEELDDLSLLRRAAISSSAVSHLSTPNPKLKIAFLFLTNSDLRFAPLWERFFRNHHALYNIYVHADPSVNVTRPPGVFRSRFIASKRTFRGSPSLISATRRLIATAVLDDPANAYFALLSQHCIPLHSFRYVYQSLFSPKLTDPTESDSELSRLGVRAQYKSFIEIISKEPRLWKRYTARGRYTMMPEVPFKQFRVGSQFFILTRRHALLVIKDRTLWRKFKIPCYRADECFPEEHYFPTLLSMEDPNGCTHYTLTRVNWTGTANGHPYTYRRPEVSPELIYQLRLSNSTPSYLFARKFTPDCLEPFMKMADSVIFQD